MNASTTLEAQTHRTHIKMRTAITQPLNIAKNSIIKARKRATHPATTGPGHVFSKFIDRVTIRPSKKLVLPIGNTFTGSAPKGFSIGLSPGNGIDEMVDMQVITSGTPQKYEYKLVVSNNGHKPVCAEIWAL
jgi:hypothetical protein